MSAYAGLKVVDCSQGLAGPMAGMLLADFGADVLKVEPPGGDRFKDKPGYQMWNRGKRRTTLDVDSGEGRAQLERLIAVADVAILDYSPRRMAALDLMDAHERHPRLIRLWMPPYGTTGAWSELEAHHGALTALTGGAWRQSSYEYQPVYLVAPFLHYAQANMGAGAAGAALYERRRSGRGQAVTMSGFNAVALVGGASGNILPPGRRPLGASPSYRTYRCGDGQYLFLATLFSYFFVRAVTAMGLTVALAEDVFPEDVTVMMEERFLEKSRDEWLDILRDADVPCGPVSPRNEWLASQLIANNDMRAVLDDAARGPIEMPGTPIKLSNTTATIRGLMRDATDAEVEAFAATPPSPSWGGTDREAVRAGVSDDSHHPTEPAHPHPDGAGAPSVPPHEGEGSTAAPLAGIRVLDLGTVIAGAYANAILGNLGAEVVKVESADGDPWRDRGVGFTAYNRGKRGLVVDLKNPEGRALFLDLVRQADVVLDNYRMGVRDRLGIGHKDVTAANPRVISGSITTYGTHGEETKRPGFDPLLQARSGMMWAQGGGAGREPVFHVMAVNDFACACTTAYGVIAALNGRDLTGAGQVLDTSLTCQSAMFQSGELTTWPGAPPAPLGDRDCVGLSALDRFYQCADGWILVAPADLAQATALAHALGHPEWTGAYDLMAEPRDGALATAIEGVLAGHTCAEALTALVGAGVRATPARDGDEVLADPYLWANDFFDQPRQTPYGPVVNRPYGHFSRTVCGYTRPEPGLGEHTFKVLADWGIDAQRIAKLADAGVVMCLS